MIIISHIRLALYLLIYHASGRKNITYKYFVFSAKVQVSRVSRLKMTRRCRGSVYLGENGVCLRVGFGCDESHCLREPTQIYTSELMARPADGEGDQVRLGWRPAPAGGRSAPAERATSSGWESYQHRQGGRPALTERATSSDREGDQLRLGGRPAPTGRAISTDREGGQVRQGERPAPAGRATSSGREGDQLR